MYFVKCKKEIFLPSEENEKPKYQKMKVDSWKRIQIYLHCECMLSFLFVKLRSEEMEMYVSIYEKAKEKMEEDHDLKNIL